MLKEEKECGRNSVSWEGVPTIEKMSSKTYSSVAVIKCKRQWWYDYCGKM